MFRPLVSARRPDCNFMMEYMVKDHDSLERIAAFHDCTVGELMKMNKMGSRMVFPGQKLMVPSPASDDIFEERRKESDSGGDQGGVEAFGEATSSVPCDERVVGSFSAGSSSKHHTLPGADGIRMGPGSAVLVQQRSLSTSSEKAPSMPLSRSKKTRSQETEQDTDCLQRFLKIKVKQVTESDGTVSGTLLVTPNALMFDPDVMHPLVIENGQDLYMMMAHMDEIMSVAVYKDIGALTGETDKVEKMYDPEHVRTPSIDDALSPSTAEDEGESGKGNVNESKFTSDDAEKPAERCAGDSSDANGNSDIRDESIVTRTGLSKLSESESALPQIAEEEQKALGQEAANQLTSSATPPEVDTINDVSSASETVGEHKAPLQAVDARAHSIKGSVTSGAGNFTQTAVSGTKSVAHEVVTHTRSAAGTLQTGIQTSAKMAATHAKVAVDAVASVPQGIVTMGSGILEGLQQTTADTSSSKEIRTEASLRREKSLATLEVLKHKTQLAREQAYREKNTAIFSCATSAEEKPELFRPVHELLAHRASSADTQQPSTELPYYMIVKLNRKRKFTRSKTLRSSSSVVTSSASFDEEPVGNRVRRQFWFAIPRHRAESIYHFLLQWSPEKYGQEASISASEEATSDNSNTASGYQFGENAFIVLDSETDDKLAGEKPATPVFGTSYLNREWEIVTVQEMCRRLSLDRLDQMVMPIPDGATSSQILDQSMIRQIMEILPVRAEGYPWVNIYSSEKHGFSLSTFYRKMMEWDEEMSPILLIIRDCEENVFGAIASTRLLPSEHFFGTGDSCLLFKFVTDPDTNEKELHSFAWTGDNQYFVKASKDSLSMGAGGGHYGLWLDADLNHGRSLRCQTFDNEPLAGDREDFNIQFLEAFGFRML
uniref:Oxidation resistance protein 1 n=1 Tax=Parascaris univalens TaxID=6257 RepID=A0A915AS97_PARUN